MRALQAAIDAAHQAVGLAELSQAALPALKSALRAHLAVMVATEDGVQHAVAGDVHDCDPELYYSRYAAGDPLQRVLREENPKIFLARAPARGPVLDAYYRPRNMNTVISTRLAGARYFAPGTTLIALFREPSEPAFSSEDADLLAQATPALEGAVLRHRHLAGERHARSLLDALVDRPVIAVTLRGRVAWMSRRAVELLGPDFHLPPEMAREGGPFSVGRFWISLRRVPGEQILVGEVAVAAREPLSAAEVVVLDALCQGQSNAEIAAALHVSLATVKTHVHHILQKLGARSRLEAVTSWSSSAARPPSKTRS